MIATLMLLHVGVFFALLLWYSVTLFSDAIALLVLLTISFSFSFITLALTLKAPSWVLGTIGALGAVGAGISVFLTYIEPEGILTPFILYLSIGITLAELVVFGDRYWRGRGKSKKLSS